jgi:hypothetical protein
MLFRSSFLPVVNISFDSSRSVVQGRSEHDGTVPRKNSNTALRVKAFNSS